MGLFKCNSENEKNINVLFDSLGKIKIEIEEIKKKTAEVEEYKSYAERISKENEKLKQNDGNKTQTKWPLYFSIGIGLLFFVFSGFCVLYLLFSTTCVKANDSIPMLTVGAIIYFVMAVTLVLFAYQSRHIFNRKEENNTKK